MIDRHSDTWLAIEKHIRERIEALRDRLEADWSIEETAKLRGELHALRGLLKLVEPSKIPAHSPAEPAY